MTMAATTNKSVAYRIPYALKEEYEQLKKDAGILIDENFQRFFINATKEKILSVKKSLQAKTDKKKNQ